MTTLCTIMNNLNDQIVRISQNHDLLRPFLIERENGSTKKTLFTRKRVFDLNTLLYFLITPRAASIPVELEEFFTNHYSPAPTKSAFSQRRRNISHDILIFLNNNLINEYYSYWSVIPKWKGLLVLAVDGTTITMPRGKRFEDLFGYASIPQTERKVPTARVVYIVDALSHIIVAAVIGRFEDDEATLAWKAIKLLPDYLINNSILLMDRLYPSHVLFSALSNLGIQYVMRARKKFNPVIDEFFDSKNTEKDILIHPSQTSVNNKINNRMTAWNLDTSILRPTLIHLTKSKLPNGDAEVIINNVWSTHISASQAYSLYGRRWGVEVVIGQEKNEEQVEIFSGYSKECILQDFYAKIITHNLTQIAANEANRWIKTSKAGKRMNANNTRKIDAEQREIKPNTTKKQSHTEGHSEATEEMVREQVNMNIGLYLVKKFILNLHLSNSKRERAKAIQRLVLEMSRFRFEVVPGRHSARVQIRYKSSGKYYTASNYRRAV